MASRAARTRSPSGRSRERTRRGSKHRFICGARRALEAHPMTAFRLPLPVSANVLVRPALLSSLRCDACGSQPTKRPIVRLVSTAEAKEFREAAHRRLPVAPVSGAVEIYCTFYVDTLATDVDNRIKSLLDALKGRLLYDDKQVAELHVVKIITPDDSKHGVVVEVRPANPTEHVELSRRLAASSSQQQANAAAQPELFSAPTERGPSMAPQRAAKHSDTRGGGGDGPPRPRAVLPEPLQQRINRLARPAVVSHRPDDEPKGAA